MTNDHKPYNYARVGVTQSTTKRSLFAHSPGGQMSRIKVLSGLFSFWGFQGKILFLPFICLYSYSRPLSPSSNTPPPGYIITGPFVWLCPPAPLYKDPSDAVGPSGWSAQSPTPRSLTSHLQSPFCHLGYRFWGSSLRGLFFILP